MMEATASGAFTITFDEAIDPATFTAADVTITGASGSAVALAGDPIPSADSRTFTLQFASHVPGTHLVTILPDVRDLAGNAMNQDGDTIFGESSHDRFFGWIVLATPTKQSVPFVQDFESAPLSELPGWSYYAHNGNIISITGTAGPHSGAAHLWFDQANGGSNLKHAEVIVDLAPLAGQSNLVLDFWLQSNTVSTSTQSMSVLVSGDGVNFIAVPELTSLKPPQKDVYTQFVLDLDAVLGREGIPLDEDVYLRFQHFGSGTTADMFLDDVRISQLDLLGPRIVASTFSLALVSLTFDRPIDPATFSSADVTIIGATGLPVSLVAEPVASGDLRTFTFVPASALPGSYVFRVGPDIADLASNAMNQDGDGLRGETNGNDQFTASPVFSTIAVGQSVPYLQGFESATLESIPSWSYSTNTGATITTTTDQPHGGGFHLKFDQTPSSFTSKAAVLRLDLAEQHNNRNLVLDFWAKVTGAILGNDLTLAVSADNSSFSTVSGAQNMELPSLDQYTHYTFDLDTILANYNVALDHDVFIRFTHRGRSSDEMTLDDLRVYDASDRDGPRIVGSSPAVAEGSFSVTFDEPIDPASFTAGDIVVVDPDGQTIAGIGQPIPSADLKTFAIPFPGGAAGVYAFRVGPGVRDIAGNEMNQDADAISGEANGEDDYEGTFLAGDPAIRLSSLTIAENILGGSIGTLSVDGAPAQTLVWTVSDGRFEIAGSVLKLQDSYSLNYETETSIALTITASGEHGFSLSEDYVIAVTNVNEAPENITLSGAIIAENVAGGTLGDVSASDPDAGPAPILSVDDARFEIVAGRLKLKDGSALDHEWEQAVVLTLTATDAAGLTTQQSFTITVMNVNEAPVAILLSHDTIIDNRAAGLPSAIEVMVVDFDFSDSHVLTVDDHRFEIVGGSLRLRTGAALGFQGANLVEIPIRATDAGGLFVEESFVLTVINENAQPSGLLLSQLLVPENAEGAVVGALTVLDANANDTFTYRISDERFVIAAGQLALKPGERLDYEASPIVALTIVATDAAGFSVARAFVLQVQDQHEPPASINLLRRDVFAGIPGAWVGELSLIDPDGASGHVWSVDDPRFVVRDGQLYVRAEVAITESAGETIPIRVTVEDQAAEGNISRGFTLHVLAHPGDWHYAAQWLPNRFDVNADGLVTPLDALLIILRLQSQGPGPVAVRHGGTIAPGFYDVEADHFITPLDAAAVINFLNARGQAEDEAAERESLVDAAWSDEEGAWAICHANAGDGLSNRRSRSRFAAGCANA